jgi:arabinofuranosyltransferase
VLRRFVVFALLLAAMVLGARGLGFLCDDAFITFRYVGNAHAGHGLCWNAPPFLPVEGYSSFLWALLLWAVWSWLGVAPPDAANVLALLCGVGQFALVAATALRLRTRAGARLPDLVAFAVLLAVVGNRTFLSWLSSGLETALFNLAFVWWVVHAFAAPQRRGTAWLGGWSLAAAVAALTRPDGLLFVAATGLVALAGLRARGARRTLLGLLPLALVAAHVGWRWSCYGELLPNTFYAKVGDSWPEAGLRYFACFAVEHGAWCWFLLALVWGAAELARGRAAWRGLAGHLPAVAAVAGTAAHFAYYTIKVGGDHFEYRVYSQLVPLGVLSAAAMAARLGTTWLPVAAPLLLWLAAGPGWLHLALTRDLPATGFRPIAAALPAFAQPLGRWFDRQQGWLHLRRIGMRCQHHDNFLARRRERLPRRTWLGAAAGPFPLGIVHAAGYEGWALPDAFLLDGLGLSDWVVARAPLVVPQPPLPSEQLRPLLAMVDADAGGYLDAAELKAAFTMLVPAAETDPLGVADYYATVFLAIYGRQRPGFVSLDEALRIPESFVGARAMAHERSAPPGYLEELGPNLVIAEGEVRTRPRDVPLTAERIRAFEQKWRAWIRAR